MDIFAYAKKMEKDGEQYYRELAEKNKNNPGVKRIMNMLADEEVKHYRIVSEMESGTPGPLQTDVLTEVKNVFVRMKEEGESVDKEAVQPDMYRKAQDVEKQSWEFYEKCAHEAGDEKQKNIFDQLAKEERKHYFLLDNIVEFVARPEQWLENAEWHHLEQY